MDNGDAMDEDIEPAAKALLDAILAQRFKANKDNLQNLIAKAEGIGLSGYTAESVETFRSAFMAAQTVMADESLSEDEQNVVDAAAKQLRDTIDGLTVKPAPGSDETTPEKTTPDKKLDSPATGDESHLTMLAAATVISLAGAAFVLLESRKRRHI